MATDFDKTGEPMTLTLISPCYEHWQRDMLDGDEELWCHLQLMERGIKGHFCQALFKAMEKADGSNQRRLYNAFFEEFNPPN